MRQAGRVVAGVLALMEEELKPGVTTAQLDTIAEDYIRKAGARPSFKGYRGFPASICVSIDDEVVHGIPGSRVIAEGQVVSVDAGAIWQGYHGDGARTFFVGTPSPEVAGLIAATRLSLMAGIAAAVPGAHMEDISGAVEDVASEGGYGIVRQYVGHGIGTEMHEDPQVPNFVSDQLRRNGDFRLVPGLVIAVEPMVNMGTKRVRTKADHWTQVTTDSRPSAHFEHTVAITEKGPWVLTAGVNGETW